MPEGTLLFCRKSPKETKQPVVRQRISDRYGVRLASNQNAAAKNFAAAFKVFKF